MSVAIRSSRKTFGLIWTLACATVAVVALGAALQAYPGYDFWRNVWCELFRPGAARFYGVLGFAAIVLASLPIWLLPARRLAIPCAVVAGIGAALTPVGVDDPIFHAVSNILAGTPFCIVMAAAIHALLRHPSPRARLPRVVGAIAAVPVAVNFVAWSLIASHLTGPSVILPVAQKAATIILIAWILSLAPLVFA
jgi:hypothetical protein